MASCSLYGQEQSCERDLPSPTSLILAVNPQAVKTNPAPVFRPGGIQ